MNYVKVVGHDKWDINKHDLVVDEMWSRRGVGAAIQDDGIEHFVCRVDKVFEVEADAKMHRLVLIARYKSNDPAHGYNNAIPAKFERRVKTKYEDKMALLDRLISGARAADATEALAGGPDSRHLRTIQVLVRLREKVREKTRRSVNRDERNRRLSRIESVDGRE